MDDGELSVDTPEIAQTLTPIPISKLSEISSVICLEQPRSDCLHRFHEHGLRLELEDAQQELLPVAKPSSCICFTCQP